MVLKQKPFFSILLSFSRNIRIVYTAPYFLQDAGTVFQRNTQSSKNVFVKSYSHWVGR